MHTTQQEKLQEITRWAEHNEDTRAVLLTSSMVNPRAPRDEYSDLDIELVIRNFDDYLHDEAWFSQFGRVIARVIENEDAFDGKNAMRMVLYEDYVKVDFKMYRIDAFKQQVAEPTLQEDWDVGYKILVDKDNLCTGMLPPTFQSVLIKKPGEKEFQQVLNDFWWDMTYVAKCLARDELFYARFMTDNMMRTQYLVPLLEWYVAVDHDWKITANKYGRLLKQFLPAALWKKTEATFAGSDITENWRALFAYADICSQVGKELAAKLGYPYPHKLELDIRGYLHWVQQRSNKVY